MKQIKAKIIADVPLEDPADDRLGHSSFAERISNALIKMATDECLIFGIYGAWGTGKSSLLNFIQHYIQKIDKNNNFTITHFNPWLFSGHSDLLNQYFKHLLITLNKKDYLKPLANLFAELTDTMSAVPTLKLLKGPTKLLKYIGKQKSLSQIREDIKKELHKDNRRILVIIDDIDRLYPNEIVTLFSFIKAVADFPNIYYLIAFDKNVVSKSLEKHLDIEGDKYLEKIVQVPFELPSVNRITLNRYFIDELNIIIADTPDELFDDTHWGNLFVGGIDFFLTSIRNIKRVTNALKVTYPSVKGEVNPSDFIAIEFLRVFIPSVYHLISRNSDMFLGYSRIYDDYKKDVLESFHNKWIEELKNAEKKAVKEIVVRLFPKLEVVFGGASYGNDWLDTWKKELRICHRDVFPIYFSYAIPEGDISKAEMKAILAITHDEKSFKSNLIELSKQIRPDGTTRLSHFLSVIQEYTSEDIPKDNIPVILSVLFDIGDELILKEDESRGMFSFKPLGNEWEISRITYQLLKRYTDGDERFGVFKTAVENGKAVSTILREISFFEKRDEKMKKGNVGESIEFNSEQYEELKGIAKDKIREAAQGKAMLENASLPNILYRWKELEGVDVVRDWVANTITDDQELLVFLKAFMSRSYSHSIDDKVGKTSIQIGYNEIELFYDADKAYDTCTKLRSDQPDWMTEEDHKCIELYIKAYELKKKGVNPEEC